MQEMRRQLLRALVLAILTAAVVGIGFVLGEQATSAQPSSLGGDIVPGEVVVVYRDDGLSASAAAGDLGARIVDSSPSLRAARVALPPGVSVQEAIERFRRTPGVAYAEPNVRLRAAALPNDERYAEQWYLEHIGMPQMWDRQTGSPSIVVALIDTGVDIGHEDLASRLWVNTRENPNDGADNDNNGCIDDINGCNFLSLSSPDRTAICGYTKGGPHNDVRDDATHGTQVAGVLAAAGNNGIGMTGAAWNVRIMAIKAMDCERNGNGFDVALAIDYAVANGARIINLSLGGPNSSGLLTAAIDSAAQKGALIFAAGGNFETGIVDFPARLPSVFAVAATAGRSAPESRASFSSWGPEIDIAAPGVSVVTTFPNNAYRTGTGTSYATPIVAGIAALLFSQNPSLTAAEVADILKRSAQDLPDGDWPNWDGAGQVRAAAAIGRVPSTFSGALRINGAPAPAGTPIEGFVGAKRCGSASTAAAPGGSVRYSFRVLPEPGCGALGAKVRFVVNGQPTDREVEWKGALQTVDLDVSFQAQGALALKEGWNLVALPINPLTVSLQQILAPIAAQVEAAIVFDSASQKFLFFVPGNPAVSTFTELRPTQGIWLRLRAPATLMLQGAPHLPGLQVQLRAGPNLMGLALPAPVAVDLALKSIEGKYVAVFGFSGGGDGAFVAYVPGAPVAVSALATLEPGKGYWIIMESPGVLSSQ